MRKFSLQFIRRGMGYSTGIGSKANTKERQHPEDYLGLAPSYQSFGPECSC
jgi:hypothetical protein